MEKHYCGECVHYVPMPGRAAGRCKIKPYIQTKKEKKAKKEFLPVRMREACKTDFVISESGFQPVMITCKYCGKTFEKIGKNKREFCPGGECRIKWYQEEGKRKRREAHKDLKCQLCGKPLSGYQRKYCKECAGKLHKPAEKKPEKAKPKKKRAVLSISEINKLALAEHMSYGEYVMKYGV